MTCETHLLVLPLVSLQSQHSQRVGVNTPRRNITIGFVWKQDNLLLGFTLHWTVGKEVAETEKQKLAIVVQTMSLITEYRPSLTACSLLTDPGWQNGLTREKSAISQGPLLMSNENDHIQA